MVKARKASPYKPNDRSKKLGSSERIRKVATPTADYLCRNAVLKDCMNGPTR